MQGQAEAHDRAALDLADHRRSVDRGADVGDSAVAQQPDLSRLAVDLHLRRCRAPGPMFEGTKRGVGRRGRLVRADRRERAAVEVLEELARRV